MTALAAAVVGLGAIGQDYDIDCRDDSRVLTHAHAYEVHPGFRLAAGVDPALEARERFTRRFGLPAYPDIGRMLASMHADVVSVAVPTALHAAAFEACAAAGVRAVICEKPLAPSVEEAGRMVARARAAGMKVLVNYMRRCDPGVAELGRRIAAGRFGEIYKGQVWYGKGLRHGGSHLLDLLLHLLGAAGPFDIVSPGRALADGDRDPDFRVRIGGTDVHFLAVRSEHFAFAKIDLLGTAGRIEYAQGGYRITAWSAADSPLFPGQRALPAEGEPLANDMRRYQYHVLEELHRCLQSGAEPVSSGASALATLELTEAICDAARRHA